MIWFMSKIIKRKHAQKWRDRSTNKIHGILLHASTSHRGCRLSELSAQQGTSKVHLWYFVVDNSIQYVSSKASRPQMRCFSIKLSNMKTYMSKFNSLQGPNRERHPIPQARCWEPIHIRYLLILGHLSLKGCIYPRRVT